MTDRIRVYLAGPISNCNERQKSEWRKALKNSLSQSEFEWIDPTAHGHAWTPDKEINDIDKSHVIVANLWKESIGTVLGIFHARQQAKPVILIDPNFIESKVLGFVLGEEPVHTLAQAKARLQQVTSRLDRRIQIRKRSGAVSEFSDKKFMKSLKSACLAAGVDEDHWAIQLSAPILHRLRQEPSPVPSARIKELVYEELTRVASDHIYSTESRKAATQLQVAWEQHEGFKNDKARITDLNHRIAELEKENEQLRKNLELQVPIARPTVKRGRRQFKSVYDVVLDAKDEFSDDLVFAQLAIDTAQQSPFRNFGETYRGLKALADSARLYRIKGLREGQRMGVRELLKEVGYPTAKYAPRESEQTMGRFARTRSIDFDGRTWNIEKHLRIGDGNPNTGLRIHFDLDTDRGRMVVGVVGRHLPTKTDPH